MPYVWQPTDPHVPPDRQFARHVHLWPHQSLSPRGFVWVIALTTALLAVPLLSVVGSAVLWGLLPFILAAVCGLWFALRRNWADRSIIEVLSLSPDKATLVRRDSAGELSWVDNPYWIRVHLHAEGGPVPNYLTLKGTGREVEIGSFLSEEERVALRDELDRALKALNHRPT